MFMIPMPPTSSATDVAAIVPKDAYILATDRAATVFLDFHLDSFSRFSWPASPDNWPDFIILDSKDTGWTHQAKDLQKAMTWILHSNRYKVLFFPSWMSLQYMDIYILKNKDVAIKDLEKYVFYNNGRWLGMGKK